MIDAKFKEVSNVLGAKWKNVTEEEKKPDEEKKINHMKRSLFADCWHRKVRERANEATRRRSEAENCNAIARDLLSFWVLTSRKLLDHWLNPTKHWRANAWIKEPEMGVSDSDYGNKKASPVDKKGKLGSPQKSGGAGVYKSNRFQNTLCQFHAILLASK